MCGYSNVNLRRGSGMPRDVGEEMRGASNALYSRPPLHSSVPFENEVRTYYTFKPNEPAYHPHRAPLLPCLLLLDSPHHLHTPTSADILPQALLDITCIQPGYSNSKSPPDTPSARPPNSLPDKGL